MKNTLRFAFITGLFTLLSVQADAQEVSISTGAAAPAAQDTTKKSTGPAPAATKTEAAPADQKKEEAAPGNGTRMAINEQGVQSKPKKKAKNAASTAPSTGTPKKDQ